jgi:hypothetical protein
MRLCAVPVRGCVFGTRSQLSLPFIVRSRSLLQNSRFAQLIRKRVGPGTGPAPNPSEGLVVAGAVFLDECRRRSPCRLTPAGT